jgi:hypothetical protein
METDGVYFNPDYRMELTEEKISEEDVSEEEICQYSGLRSMKSYELERDVK